MIEPRQKVLVDEIVLWYEKTEERLLTVESLDYGGALHLAHHVIPALTGVHDQGAPHQGPTFGPLFYDLFAGIKFDKLIGDLFAKLNASPGDGRCSLKRRPPEWSLSDIMDYFRRPLLICRAPASLPVVFWDRFRVELEKSRSGGGFRMILFTQESVQTLCERLPIWQIVVGATLCLSPVEWIEVFELLRLVCPGIERVIMPMGGKPAAENVSDEAIKLLLAIGKAAGGDRSQICTFAVSLANNEGEFTLETIQEHLRGWRVVRYWDPIEGKWKTRSPEPAIRPIKKRKKRRSR